MYILFWESSARYKKLWEKRTRRNNSTYGKLEIVFSRVWALKHPPLAPILQRGQWSIKRDPHIAKNHDMKSSMSKMTSRSIRWDHNVKIVCTVEFTIYRQPLYETLQYKKFETFQNSNHEQWLKAWKARNAWKAWKVWKIWKIKIMQTWKKLPKNKKNKKIQIYRSASSLIFPNFSQEFSKLSDFHVAK